MAQTAGVGTVWNLPNYVGELYTADAVNTPLLSALGGLGAAMRSSNFEFPISSEYDFPSATQPEITETESLTAATGVDGIRTQTKNVCQPFRHGINVSYMKQAGMGRLSGINTDGSNGNVTSEMDWQIAYGLQLIARDIEYSFLNGSYQIATNAGVANKTRGVLEAASDAGNTDAATGAALSSPMVNAQLKEMAENGAMFRNMVIYVNAFQKQALTKIYGYAPADRNIGGVNVERIATDFGIFPVVYNRFMAADNILFADLSVMKPVFQEVPGKGLLFFEEKSNLGAADVGELFGLIGLDHGPGWMHGSITGLATS